MIPRLSEFSARGYKMAVKIIEKTGQMTWTKNPFFKKRWMAFLVWALVILYIILASRSVVINPERIALGVSRAGRLISGFLHLDFHSRGKLIVEGIFESLAMTVAASSISVLFSVLLALGASRNLVPKPVYYACRLVLMLIRSLHVVVLGIIFVIMLGFGPLAGVLTLMLNSIGFVGKLLAEDIENMDGEQLDAIRSTGANWPQLVIYGVWPQISTRFIGLSIYRADINFRQSTIIGIVGAGGIGTVLNTAMGRYDYNTAGAILLVIIVLVLLAEYASSAIRRRIV